MPSPVPGSKIKRLVLPLSLCLLSAPLVLTACGDQDTSDTPPPPPPPIERAVSAHLSLSVDPTDAALKTTHAEPVASPVKVSGGSGDLTAVAFVHKPVKDPDKLRIELFLQNRTQKPLAGITVSIGPLGNAASLYDFTADPLAQAPSQGPLQVGGVAPEGLEHLTLGVKPTAADQPVTIELDVAGKTARYTATSSAPLQLTSDDKELWVAQPDGDAVVVSDTTGSKPKTVIPVAGHPTGLAITADDKLVLVTSARSNEVRVFDRASRSVVQTFGESDGIGREPRYIVAAPDGSRAYVSAYVGDSITQLVRSGDRFMVAGSAAVSRRPVGLSVSPDGATVMVAHFMPRGKITENYGVVTVLDANPFKVASEAQLNDDANTKDSECFTDLFHLPKDRAIDLTFEGVPTQLAGIFLSPSGTQGVVPGLRIGGAIPIWEGEVEKVGLGPIQGRFSPAFQFFLDTRDPKHVDTVKQPGILDLPDTSVDLSRCMDLRLQIESPTRSDVMPGVIASPGAAFPSGLTALSETGAPRFIAFTRGGRRRLVLSYLADEVVVYDAMTNHPTSLRHFMLSGSNPTGIAVSRDGSRGYVAYENSVFVSVLDLSAYADPAALPPPSYVPFELKVLPGPPATLFTRAQALRYVDKVPDLPPIKELSQIQLLDKDPVDPVLRRGRVLFNSSNPTKYPQISVNREAACAACHPDGGNDGSAWATMEGERRTMGLWGGTAGRGWLHQSASHKDASEFVRSIIPERLGGKMTAEADFDAITQYLARGIARVQPPKTDAALVARGKQVFMTKCVGCHAGDHYTSGRPGAMDPIGGGDPAGPGLFDLGTATDNAHVLPGPLVTSLLPPAAKQAFDLTRGDRKLGTGDQLQTILNFRQRPDRPRGQFKAPSLLNSWENTLFFHDGRFDKLEDAIGYINTQLRAGLTADDLKAVTEYVKSL